MRLDPVLERHLPSEHGHTILDLGCGKGALVRELRERGYRCVTGVDQRKQWKDGEDFLEWEMFSFLFNLNDIPYSTIIMWDVVEHLPRHHVMDDLKQVHKNLRDDGTLILHLPNAEGLFGSRILHSDLTHRWAYTPQLITHLLTKAGFTDVRCYEARPIIHGPVSFLRYVAWVGISFVGRVVLAVETGVYNGVMSQNMVVVAKAWKR